MNIADAVPNLLIGLREGLEAGLVVSILLAALRKITPALAPTSGSSSASGNAASNSAPDTASGSSGKDTSHGTGYRGGEGASDGGRSPSPGALSPASLSAAPVWLGVAGAVALSGSFAAVLTFSTSTLSSSTQEAVGGVLSVLAVLLVTAMVFWMRRTARTLSRHLRGEVERAARIGAGALTVTAFLAVGREGLETTLFLWTAAKASGQTAAPIVGAAIGIAAAVIVCVLLYRQAMRLNIGVFFNRTAIALIVIAAGVLAYGLGDLQDAGLLPGRDWVAFDLTAHIDPGSWYASIVTGITELSPRMTVLQVTAWLAYLIVVIPAFLRAGRSPAPAPATPAPATPASPAQVPAAQVPGDSAAGKPASAAPQPAPAPASVPAGHTLHDRWEHLAGNRPWTVGGVLVAVPVIVAGAVIAAIPAESSSAATAVTVTKSACAPGWTSARTGTQTFTVTNQTSVAGEINLDNAAGAVVGEIETIGPATSATLTATLGAGTYTFKCLMGSQPATASQPVTLSGQAGDGQTAGDPAPVAVKPVTVADLTPANKEYEAYAASQLAALAGAVTQLRAALGHGDIHSAQRIWLTAQQDWERVGASYDSFGDLGLAVDGLPDGLLGGVNDPGFTGLHRLEYGLWHGQPAPELDKVAATLASDVAKVRAGLTSDDLAGDPTNLPVRGHEILEDALRDHLSGIDDQGAGVAYPMTEADLQVTRVVLGYLAPLINARQPGLLATADAEMNALQRALDATGPGGQQMSLDSAPPLVRQQVTGALGALLETLSSVPDLLEVPPTH